MAVSWIGIAGVKIQAKELSLSHKTPSKLMEQKQISLLRALVKKLKSEKRDKAEAIESLQAAKILTKSGNFTGHYSSLGSVLTK